MIITENMERRNQERRAVDITEILFRRLFRRGLLSAEIPRFLKDVLTVVEDDGRVSASAVNERLERLGWREGSLDERTLELILHLYEGRSYLVPRQAFQPALEGSEIRAS